MNRPAVVIDKRKPLTRREVIQLMLDQEGRCGCGCGEKLQPMTEGVIDEHVIPLGIRENANELANRALYRKPCAAKKTPGDQSAIAKCKRIEARENGTRRERKAIPSRGFDKRQTRGFDGKVRLRKAASGETGAVGMEPQGGGMNQKDDQ
jgi:hypothetical protein